MHGAVGIAAEAADLARGERHVSEAPKAVVPGREKHGVINSVARGVEGTCCPTKNRPRPDLPSPYPGNALNFGVSQDHLSRELCPVERSRIWHNTCNQT